MVQPPVQVFGTEGRYATALYSAATKKKALAAVEKDLTTLEATLKKDVRLSEFLADPSVSKPLKAQGLTSVCDKLKMNELSKNCLIAMGENGRYNLLGAVAKSFGTIMAAHRGEVICEVTTHKVRLYTYGQGPIRHNFWQISTFLKDSMAFVYGLQGL